MMRSKELDVERATMTTMVELTSAFEGIASAHIAQIREQVLMSQQFFGDLWRIYSQIRVDGIFHFGRDQKSQIIDKELLILITSEGSFSGDIDQRLVNEVVKVYDSAKNDVLVIGHHGALLVSQKGIPLIKSFKTPERDLNINTSPIVAEVQKYKATLVYYQRYNSLMSQTVESIHLSKVVMEMGGSVKAGEDVINEQTYIFEPSAFSVVSHLERSMMQISLSEVILESKLAQYASRFRAMSIAKDRANETLGDVTLMFNRAKRHEKDERLKEVMNGLRKAEA
ncbi:MAG TPA: F0F1 ATP synthase subunit gamma [Candidatus Saccharimonadales bacterium]|nr:F0F1 ATP synthase subunit gamma [Candidatus Saccharimonadales bacterium]